MAITIQTVASEDLVDQGRTKFNSNDTAIANGLTALQSQLDTHDHNDTYYTEAEVDAKIAALSGIAGETIIEFAIDDPDLKFAGIAIGSAGIPVIGASVLVGASSVCEDGTSSEWAPVGEIDYADGDLLSVDFFQDATVDPWEYTIYVRLYRNGVSQGMMTMNTNTWPQKAVIAVKMRRQ